MLDVQKAVGPFASNIDASHRALGVDVFVGKPKPTSVRKTFLKRKGTFLERQRKLKRLTVSGAPSTSVVYTTGIMRGLCFGVSVTGMDPQTFKMVRSGMASSLGVSGPRSF